MMEILPCPFCGGEGELKGSTIHIDNYFSIPSGFIVCKNCGARTKDVAERMGYSKFDRTIYIFKFWNTRVTYKKED